MTKRLIQVAKFFEKKVGDGGRIAYHPVKTGIVSGGSAPSQPIYQRSDLLFLATERRQLTIAFTDFCPLHATNAHPALKCKQWQIKRQMQLNAKAASSEASVSRQEERAQRNETAFQSRQRERDL